MTAPSWPELRERAEKVGLRLDVGSLGGDHEARLLRGAGQVVRVGWTTWWSRDDYARLALAAVIEHEERLAAEVHAATGLTVEQAGEIAALADEIGGEG